MVEWVDELPPPRGREGQSAPRYREQVAPLADRPGQWAVLRRYPLPLGWIDVNVKNARNYAWRLRRALGAEGYEFAVRPVDDDAGVFGRLLSP